MTQTEQTKQTDPSVQTAIPQSLIVTDSAASKVRQLILEEGNEKLNLRVYITGGGCSGFQYGFTFDETLNADDTIINKTVEVEGQSGAVKVVIDPMSFQYLVGAEIDYVEDINGARFVIRNPNASTTCGCGSSFAA